MTWILGGQLWRLELGKEAKDIVDDFRLLFDVDDVLSFNFVFFVELELLVELRESHEETIFGFLLPIRVSSTFELFFFLNSKPGKVNHSSRSLRDLS